MCVRKITQIRLGQIACTSTGQLLIWVVYRAFYLPAIWPDNIREHYMSAIVMLSKWFRWTNRLRLSAPTLAVHCPVGWCFETPDWLLLAEPGAAGFSWLLPPSNGEKKIRHAKCSYQVVSHTLCGHGSKWSVQDIGVTYILKHLSFPPLATLCPSGLQSTAKTWAIKENRWVVFVHG